MKFLGRVLFFLGGRGKNTCYVINMNGERECVCVCVCGGGRNSVVFLRGKTVGRRETPTFPHSAP